METDTLRHDAIDSTPLFVDLDGTLLKTDLLFESAVQVLKNNPLMFFSCLIWMMQGKAYLKRQLAKRANLQVEKLPYHTNLLSWLHEQKQAKREIILVTGSDVLLAKRVASYLGIFSQVFGSDGKTNLVGNAKRQLIQSSLGARKYAYVGDSWKDLPVWRSASQAVVVSKSKSLLAQLKALSALPLVFSPRRRSTARSIVKLVRPHQWAKNALIFVAPLMAHRFSDFSLWGQALLAFASFSLCASSIYIFNDVMDIESDRAHDKKKLRPLASGDLDLRLAMVFMGLLLGGGLLISRSLPTSFTWTLFAYVGIATLYSTHLKRILIVDVVVLALFYTLRLFAGSVAVGVPISNWLMAFSIFLFFSLALQKRHSATLAENGTGNLKGRAYHPSDATQIARLGSASGMVAVMVLALYINSPEIAKLYTVPSLLWGLCPLFLYWISRIWILSDRGEVDEDPVVFTLKDRASHIIIIAILTLVLLAI